MQVPGERGWLHVDCSCQTKGHDGNLTNDHHILQADRTPLHYAKAVSDEMVAILENHGADTLAKDVVSICFPEIINLFTYGLSKLIKSEAKI